MLVTAHSDKSVFQVDWCLIMANSHRYDCQYVWDNCNKDPGRVARRDGSNKKADFFRYKDWMWAHWSENRDKATAAFVDDPDVVVEFHKLMILFVDFDQGLYSDNDLAWDKARECVDKIANKFYSLGT